jgi:hypothetical protein
MVMLHSQRTETTQCCGLNSESQVKDLFGPGNNRQGRAIGR